MVILQYNIDLKDVVPGCAYRSFRHLTFPSGWGHCTNLTPFSLRASFPTQGPVSVEVYTIVPYLMFFLTLRLFSFFICRKVSI